MKIAEPKAIVAGCAFALTLVIWGTSTLAADLIDGDILLRGGEIHIGDGSEGRVGDVAISGDTIVAVGNFEPGKFQQIIDCEGLIVCPGFIDLHNHSDRPVLQPETRAVINYLTQGCTTIVTGNCGGGPTDVGKYYRQIDELSAGVNVAHLLPQGAVRSQVMGSERRTADEDELEEMQSIARQAMLDGAWGMSSGLIYVPSSYADTDELAALASVVAEFGGIYASHIRGEGSELLDSVREALEIGRRSSAAVHISHFKSSGKDSWGLVRTASDIIERARQAGQVVTADQYPYTASSTSLSATFLPSWSRAGGSRQTLERLVAKNEEGERLRRAIEDKLRQTDNGHRIQIAYFEPRSDWAGKRLDQIAAAEKVSPLELITQIEQQGGASVVNHSINEEDVRFVMQLPWVATASDGSSRIPSAEIPHPRSYGTFSRKLGFYAEREQVISLEQAIRSSSGLPADVLGMTDRGYLRVGLMADVVVLDRDAVIDTATFEAPHGYSQGMHYVFVNGVPAIAASCVTGALAGKALRHVPPARTN